MNIENYRFLEDSLKYLGFGKDFLLIQKLQHEMIGDSDEFELETEATINDHYKMKLTLHFKKDGALNLLYLTKYKAKLGGGDDPNQGRTHVFPNFKEKAATLMEAYNLLSGRAVNKDMVSSEGFVYRAWVALAFKERDKYGNYKLIQYRDSYGYELEKILDKYPIRELQTDDNRARIIKSLKKGNLQWVHFDRATKTELLLIAANPRYKTICIYPMHGNKPECIADENPIAL
jgi:hypothetical protein